MSHPNVDKVPKPGICRFFFARVPELGGGGSVRHLPHTPTSDLVVYLQLCWSFPSPYKYAAKQHLFLLFEYKFLGGFFRVLVMQKTAG